MSRNIREGIAFAIVVIGVVLLAAAIAVNGPRAPLPQPTVTVTVDRVEEDEAGWDCTTMGNHTCGTPAYEDERYQDPSGYPYCVTPDDGLRPCIDAQTEEVHQS